MMMTLCTSADYVVSQWSGGVTTQIAIAPEGAVYADRDFLWRLSSATVDLEESTFTALPDYNRLVSILSGTLVMNHEDGKPIPLAPYEIYAFDGGIKSQGRGRCVDFNLMMRKGRCQGTLQAICTKDAQKMSFAAESERPGHYTHTTQILYCAEGDGAVSFENQTVTLLPGQSALIQNCENEVFALSSSGPAAFLLAKIYF